jgi:glycosyltransferase involved in cell wall biosynthesis
MKVICVHPRFASLSSHHFNESYGLMQEFHRRGTEFMLLINVHASAQIAAAVHGRAVIDDPTFCMEWSFRERSDRFLAMLHAQIDAAVQADDRVLITVSTQLEAHALTRWLQDLPADRKPWIVVLILSDRWNRSTQEEYARQVAEFGVLKAALAALAPEDARRILFFTLTDLLARELTELLGVTVAVAPMPLEYGDADVYRAPERQGQLPRIAILGGVRREKGSYLLPGIVRACRGLVAVEFLVQLVNNGLSAQEMAELTQIAQQPHVTVIPDAISLAEYNIALNSTDIALFPYEVIPYRKRGSGVFAEAVAYAKPVIATTGTWMAEQIEAGRAAGVVFDYLEPECIARAIAQCVANLDSLQRAAAGLSGPWRDGSGIAGFVKLMEAQIAARAATG